jgi:DNA polymerase I-like protein with 3'-5' exonuclease and polymerase domains
MIESSWRPPTEFPNIRGNGPISVDLETYDPDLIVDGPGGVRGNGYIVGISLAVAGHSAYYPVRHEGGDNCPDIGKVVAYVKSQLSGNEPKIGANILYDLEWLATDPKFKIRVNGPKYDVQIAEPLLDEGRLTYSLDSLGVSYFNEHKNEDLMTRAAVWMFHLTETDPKKLATLVKQNLWRLPARFVGPYCEKDTELPLRIIEKQIEAMKRDEVWDLFRNIEAPMVDLLLLMRLQGVPVNLDRAEVAAKHLDKEYNKVMMKVRRRCGFDPNVWAAEDLVKACEKLKIPFERTAKGNPSFTADFFEESDNEFLKLLHRARKLDRGGAVFIRSKIIKLAVNGRVHPQFWQVKSDSNGTVSGRFASSNPNMQQVPSPEKDHEIGPLVRACFVPDAGKEWLVSDYSQQEPRVLLHYASLCGFAGAAEGVRRYRENPATDYHQFTADMAGIERKPAKTINLGLSYGMGAAKLALKLERSLAEAKALSNQYHAALPYVRQLGNRCQELAKSRGYIKTILGRRRHFNLYGPPKWEKGVVPLRYDEAIEKFGRPVQVYFLHKALNALVQGTSADMIKKAMLDTYDQLGLVPYITVHDENDYGVTDKHEAKKVVDCMINAIKLELPLKVDAEIGPSWGEVQKVEL